MLWKWQQSFVSTNPSMSLTTGCNTRGAGYRQGLEGWMMPVLHHRSQVAQLSLHSRSWILVERDIQTTGITRPCKGSLYMCWGLEETLFVHYAQVQSLTVGLRLFARLSSCSFCRLCWLLNYWNFTTLLPCLSDPRVFSHTERFLLFLCFKTETWVSMR